MADDFLDEVIHYAEWYLGESGIRAPTTPEAIELNHTTDSKVDYVSRTNRLVFSNVDETEQLEINQDTIKLLGRIYSGLKDDFTFDSDNYKSFDVAMNLLPENWEVPFSSMDLEDPEELRLASELWRRRGDRIEPVIDALRNQTDEFMNSYDDSAEPIDEFSRMVSPTEDESVGVISDYMVSEMKEEVIDNLLAGDKEALKKLDEIRHDAYQRAESNGYSKEEVDQKIDEIKDSIDDVREDVERLNEAENYLIGALEWEIEAMLENETPKPTEVATAYMLEPLVNGTIEEPSMHDSVENYLEEIKREEGEEAYKAAESIFEYYKGLDREKEPTERFKQAVEMTEIRYS